MPSRSFSARSCRIFPWRRPGWAWRPTLPEGRPKAWGQTARKPAPDPKTRARAAFVLSRNAAFQDAKQELADTIRAENRIQAIPAAAIAPGHVAGPVRAAFFENNDKPAVDSLQQHIGQTTHLFPVWLLLSPGGAGIQNIAQFSDKSAAAAETRADTNDDIALDAGPRSRRRDPAGHPELRFRP